jgi:hypothetical protein
MPLYISPGAKCQNTNPNVNIYVLVWNIRGGVVKIGPEVGETLPKAEPRIPTDFSSPQPFVLHLSV